MNRAHRVAVAGGRRRPEDACAVDDPPRAPLLQVAAYLLSNC
ncbi:hypothetical protein J2S43_004533 [Catenuloplanes nepalensis]|uniref:Uncharacterized protein n=1 Tax=Catenuloplanes nepalensis TaxID=587533 RepID=A0ABT9MXP9_9ACTN|nr:hypothetical protein [Catenuloplanes nepalensis]MDP9796021.1 hypothetical protein [Catenuloplanes nepalensis]